MTLREVLSLLNGVKRSGEDPNQYLAKCPCHDDKAASLAVSMGRNGIVLHCLTEICRTEDIVKALGLKMSDLFIDEGKQRSSTSKPAKPAPAAAPETSSEKSPKRFVCSYDYTDEKGALLYQICRFVDDSTGAKTFSIRQPDASKPSGWNWKKSGARMVLYHLPDVRAAIESGEPVFVCEGEKDCDTMKRLGRIATTNAFGAGKWDAAYSEMLVGANVIIVPDNDEAGVSHAKRVLSDISDKAKSVKLINLVLGCPDLKTKGDVTDLVELVGDAKALKILDQLVANAKAWEPSPIDKIAAAYKGIDGYIVFDGQICTVTDKEIKPLSNFVAMPYAVVEHDDGVNVIREMLIDGWTRDGRQLPRAHVKYSEYSSMSWVTNSWGFDANIMPGNATRDKLRYVIGEVGRKTAEKIFEYNHCGWRKIDGTWCYLFHGGAIGAEAVNVSLDGLLSNYRLDSNGNPKIREMKFAQAASHSLEFREIMPERVSVPLLGTCFLAPLRTFLDMTGAGPSYSLFVVGGTGSHKSTVTALTLAHFGNFNYKNLPASFNDTSGSIRRKAFIVKDAPIVIDDYHPVSSIQERRELEKTAQTLSRAFGDGADRGRLGTDLSLRQNMPPRGVAIISGEDTPGVGQSGLARYYIVNISKGEIPVSEKLTELQELARDGVLQRSMVGYIKWLQQQTDGLPALLHELFLQYRKRAAEHTNGQHDRSPENIAHIMLGYDMMLAYMKDVGVLTQRQCREESDRAWRVVFENAKAQAADTVTERPSQMFVHAITDLLTSRSCMVTDLRGDGNAPKIGRDLIGYRDESYYYLIPNAAYRAVAKLFQDEGRAFPLTMKMLYKQLREDGVTDLFGSSNETTRTKKIEGRTQRLLWIPVVAIDGKEAAPDHQERMSDDFTESESPFDEE